MNGYKTILFLWILPYVHVHVLTYIAYLTESCQLLRRHWSITYSDGRTEVVDGEGVIGEQPTFNPGDLYQYSSCIMFEKEEYCHMEGYFLMKYLNRGELYVRW